MKDISVCVYARLHAVGHSVDCTLNGIHGNIGIGRAHRRRQTANVMTERSQLKYLIIRLVVMHVICKYSHDVSFPPKNKSRAD
jgi:hypothetical protein